MDYVETSEPTSQESSLQLSRRDLEVIVSSGKFLRALATASRITRKKGTETGFTVSINPGKDIFIGSVSEGRTDSMDLAEEIEDIDQLEDAEDILDYEYLLSLHFHPGAETPEPSPTDLFLLTKLPLLAIASVKDNGEVLVLFLSRKGYFDRYHIEEYEESDRFDPEKLELNTALIRFGHKFGKYKPQEDLSSFDKLGIIRIPKSNAQSPSA